jgi:rhodanese-related sulfurtransferase
MKHRYIFFSSIMLLVFPVGLCAGYLTISADSLRQWITTGTTYDFLLIDVRNTSEVTASAVIATDECKPYLLSWNQGTFIQAMSKLPKDTVIVLYCASGNRSGQAAQLLSDSGFKKVYSLVNGFSGWGSRPTKPASDIKPTDKLPEPSMLKKSSTTNYPYNISSVRQELHFWGNKIAIAFPITTYHTIYIFNAQGRCIMSEHNPFVHGTVWFLNRLKESFYAVKLVSDNNQSLEAVGIVKK